MSNRHARSSFNKEHKKDSPKRSLAKKKQSLSMIELEKKIISTVSNSKSNPNLMEKLKEKTSTDDHQTKKRKLTKKRRHTEVPNEVFDNSLSFEIEAHNSSFVNALPCKDNNMISELIEKGVHGCSQRKKSHPTQRARRGSTVKHSKILRKKVIRQSSFLKDEKYTLGKSLSYFDSSSTIKNIFSQSEYKEKNKLTNAKESHEEFLDFQLPIINVTDSTDIEIEASKRYSFGTLYHNLLKSF